MLLLGLSNIFAAISGYLHWPWWIACLVGAVAGMMAQNSRLLDSALGPELESRTARSGLMRAYIISVLWGGVVGAVYGAGLNHLVRYLTG